MGLGRCKECNRIYTGIKWCKACNANRFQQNFKNWTSGNDDINKFIQDAQLSATDYYKVLEWIPYDRFYNIEYIAKGGFGIIYKATWIDGYIVYWDIKNQNWFRPYPNMFIALKSLNNSKDVTSEFINEITSNYKIMDERYYHAIIRLYGITQDPITKNYMMVLHYAKNGSLRNYLDENYDKMSWHTKIPILWSIANGLFRVHVNDIIHRDLHIGNILHTDHACITDMGLCKPADYNSLENTKKNIYGVLPYIAPEILRGQNYTKASDIYSFGIIMYEVISGLPPYHDVSHDINLAMKICYGLRPRFNIKVPQFIMHLIKRCLDANPLNRPSASEIKCLFDSWYNCLNDLVFDEIEETEKVELVKQSKKVDEINNNNLQNSNNAPFTSLSYETHSEAIYTSRLLNFNNLPQPKNSDDYYEQYDNIISTKYSESIAFDFTQLKICEDDQNNESKDKEKI